MRSMHPGTCLCHCQPPHVSLLPFTCAVGTEQGPLTPRDRRLWAAGAQALPGGEGHRDGRKEGNSRKLPREMPTLGSLSGRGEGGSGYQDGDSLGGQAWRWLDHYTSGHGPRALRQFTEAPGLCAAPKRNVSPVSTGRCWDIIHEADLYFQ